MKGWSAVFSAAVAVIACGLAAVLVWWLSRPDAQGLSRQEMLERVKTSGREERAAPAQESALAVKAIKLIQGEHGSELWRLYADWGSMREEKGVLEIEKPRFIYYMPPDNMQVHVSANTGDVHEASKIIHFRDAVEASYAGRSIRGPRMLYNGTSRVLLFPESAEFKGPDLEGRASVVAWRLSDRVVSAEGGVAIRWEGTPAALGNMPGRNDKEAEALSSGASPVHRGKTGAPAKKVRKQDARKRMTPKR